MTRTIYISTDIETDGPCPGLHSMLSFASVAYEVVTDNQGRNPTITRGSTFGANLHLLPEANPDPDTMKWWAENPHAYAATRVNLKQPEYAMKRYAEWLEQLGAKPVCVAYPAGFDFTWLYYYLHRFAGRCPFQRSCLDVRSFGAAMLKIPYPEVGKRTMPARWQDASFPHTHKALDDALEQGELFCAMLRESLNSLATPDPVMMRTCCQAADNGRLCSCPSSR